MIYSYQPKNKFAHLLLDEWFSEQYKTVQKQFDWLKENFGLYGDTWIRTHALICDGKKIYWRKALKYAVDYEDRDKIRSAIQWGFKTKEDAMAFKLVWTK